MSESQSGMSSPQNREEALFLAAVQLTGAERTTFLNGACQREPALRERLEALLAAYDAPDELSPKDAPAAVATMQLELEDAPDETVGQKIGRYKILERVGEGGCGVVYVAEQTEPVRRRVALKVIKLGMDTKQVVARFEAERQALALMDHPNIAKVLDAGTTEVAQVSQPAVLPISNRQTSDTAKAGEYSDTRDTLEGSRDPQAGSPAIQQTGSLRYEPGIRAGRPYFVMELVRGIRITDYCDQTNLTTKERLDLFIKVCQAIQHAHQKGIIHRDIKPSNILVTLHDGVPVPKVIDFGIAKATEGRLTDNTVYTQLHQFIGTPAYMSPEQAEMSGLDIDTRSDIYSLGVLLYELLTGSTPFDAKELMASGIDAMRKTIREKDPMRPSTKLATLKGEELTTTAKRRSADSAKLMHQLKGDLDWIVMKCLEKDRTRRYETANGLAADLKRHLNNEPVLARPPSAAYKFQKAFRRNKLVFAAGTAIAAALVLGVIGTSIGLVRAERERRVSEAQRRAAQEAQRLAEQRFDSANQFVNDVFEKVAPEFQGLIGAAKARERLAQISLTFVQSLGEASSTDETYQTSLASLYGKLSDALGGVYGPNALGDYDTALQYANQSLAISRDLLSKHPTDQERRRVVANSEQRVGTLLEVLEEYNEALVHVQRFVETAEEMLKANPTDADAINRSRAAHLYYASVLRGQGHKKEALEQNLRYGKEWLEHPVPMSANPTNDEAMSSYIEQWVVGMIHSELNQPSEALPLYEQALQWNKLFSDCEPNNARWPRDWCDLHGALGKTQIALGRFDEGMTNLQVAVARVESLVQRDPDNGLSQALLANLLQEEGKGWMKLAGSPGISSARQAELWQRAITALTRSQEKLNSAQLAHMPQSQLTKQRSEIESALSEARNASARLGIDAETNSSAP